MTGKAKWIAAVLSLSFFATIALGGCSSDLGEKKDVVSSSDSSTESHGTPTIEESVLVDSNGIKITAKEYVTDSIWGDGIKLLIENSSDKDYTVGCDALIVNDYMIHDLFGSKIAAGKSANETMYLSSSGLKAAGIDTVGKIEMYFRAYDSDWNNVFQNEYAEIQTSEYANMDTTTDDSGTELFNEDGIRIVGKAVDENSFWGTAILLHVENNSGRNVSISVDDMSINGFMMTPLFSTTVYNGKKAIDDITVFSNDLKENGIESIEDVELKFRIFDTDSFSIIKDTDPITFSAK